VKKITSLAEITNARKNSRIEEILLKLLQNQDMKLYSSDVKFCAFAGNELNFHKPKML